MVNWIVVKVNCKCWRNSWWCHFYSQWQNFLQSLTKLTFVHRTVPVSFVTDSKSDATDCKSDTEDCEFCQNLQSGTVAIIAIWLTITRGGNWNQTQYALGVVENRNFWFCMPPRVPGWGGGVDWKCFTRTGTRQKHFTQDLKWDQDGHLKAIEIRLKHTTWNWFRT